VTDSWLGIDMFFEPGREILVAGNGGEVLDCLDSLTPRRAGKIGEAAYRRVLAEHTYAHRAALVDAVLEGVPAGAAS
jgi:spore maturation protein CgeB